MARSRMVPGVEFRNGRIVASGTRSGGSSDGEANRSSSGGTAASRRIAARTEARNAFNRAVNA